MITLTAAPAPPLIAPASDPCLTVRELDFFYGTHQVLFRVNVDVYRNEILALIGPSGCGKSTFLRCLNRLNELVPAARWSGAVHLDGRDIYGPRTDVMQLRRRVGMVFQRPNLFPLSIADNIAFGLRINGLTRGRKAESERIELCLRSAGLWEEVKDRLHRPALALSGGQQQRLCIARALAVEPEILLMDEPASALDPVATARLEDLARELKERYTIVIVTHNLPQAARLSDRTCFFLDGRVVEVDATRRLFTQPACKATEEYITGRFG